jgi:hypothetical protein
VTSREQLRQTFDKTAADYLQARPEYPDALYAALISLAALNPDSDALCEVGAGPGRRRCRSRGAGSR